MAKNDVQIIISAKDDAGPGVDSARQKFGALGKTIERDLVSQTIKLGAAVAALQGGFKLASAAVSAFQGDGEAAARAMETLPLGIGGVIASLRELGEAFGTSAQRAKESVRTIRDAQDQLDDDRVRVSLRGRTDLASQIVAIEQKQTEEIRKLRDEASKQFMEDMKKFGHASARDQASLNQERIAVIEAGYEREKEIARDAAAAIINERKNAESVYLAQRMKELTELATKESEAQLAAFFKPIDNFAQAEVEAANQYQEALASELENLGKFRFKMPAIELKLSPAAQLPGGESSRFGTGLAAQGSERMRQQAANEANALMEAKKTNELLEKLANIALQAGPPIGVAVLKGIQ